jgi:D-beta-D-heptose 7-phosphate kinase/D-beta-D-heptose 1-phosphate adenosyltransferase
VLIVGDLILDHCLWGSVERTTPEAPVPIVRHERDTWGLGGAANVAHNVTSLRGKAFLVGTVGRDEAGAQMLSLLKNAGIDTSGVVSVEGRPTTLKTRVMSMGQQLLRIDREETGSVNETVTVKLAAAVRRLVGKCGAVLLSDYAKGVLGSEVITTSLEEAHRRGVSVLVDPKGQDYSKYRGADLLTPNLREATLAVGYPIASDADLERAGRQLIRQCGLQAIVITLGPEGMAIVRSRGAVARIPHGTRCSM